MNKLILSAILATQTVTASVLYTAVDDPRCHDDPRRPVLEPTPNPTPFPPPPGEMREFEPPATTAPPPEVPCTGEVTGFEVYDLDTGATTALTDGQTIELSSMPQSFTIKAVTSSDSLTKVELFLGDSLFAEDTEAPYLFGDSNFLQLNTEGTFALKAVGPTDTPGLTCAITVTTSFANPHDCEGIIQQFALFDTDTQSIVPGYSLLEDMEVLKMSELPENLSIIAVDNGRGNGEIRFGYGSDDNYSTTSSSPAAISGSDASGNVLPWEAFSTKEFVRIRATSKDVFGNDESKECELNLQIEQDWVCPHHVSGFAIYYGGTKTIVPGYSNVLGHKAIDLGDIGTTTGLSIEALAPSGRIEFFLNNVYVKTEGASPFAINGDGSGLYEYTPLRNTGTYVIEAKRENEGNEKRCRLVLTIQKDSVSTINNDEFCAPEAVIPEQIGNLLFEETPVVVTGRVTNETVTFKTVNTIARRNMDWITTAFSNIGDYEVCDKIENIGYGEESEYEYTVKCFDGFAYADVYAYSSTFTSGEASADISVLPSGCKTPGADNVLKYTFVFSCDCENIPDVPDDFIGGPNKKELVCSGATGHSWGEPHIVPYHASRGNGGKHRQWDCQGVGEFVLAKAELLDYPYDFEMRARFTKFDLGLDWSFNSAMVAKQDVTVQISMGNIGDTYDKPNMMDNVPIFFYVDGVPRFFHEGSGDPRVSVVVENEYFIVILFKETAIQITIQVRPFVTDDHAGLMRNSPAPGSFSTYLCLPDNNDKITNVVGLLGTPTESFDDNFMFKNGTFFEQTFSNSKNDFTDYCEQEWCITDPADTFFTFEGDKTFEDYNECGTRRRRMEVTEADCDSACQEICAAVDMSHMCITEYVANGETGAREAVYQIKKGDEIVRESEAAESPDDARCCSSDYKTCIEGCEELTAFFCHKCDPDATFLPKGTYELRQGRYKDCIAKSGAVAVGESCCPGLKASDGVCVVDDVERRLGEFKLARPDIPQVRNIVPLHTEL